MPRTPTPAERIRRSNFPKSCRCCGATYSAERWTALHYVGRNEDDVETIEMRNCPCGGTMAIVVGIGPRAAAALAEGTGP